MYNLLSQVAARKLPFFGFTPYYGAAALFAKVFLFFQRVWDTSQQAKIPVVPGKGQRGFYGKGTPFLCLLRYFRFFGSSTR